MDFEDDVSGPSGLSAATSKSMVLHKAIPPGSTVRSSREKLALDFIGGEEPVISGDAVPEPRGFPEEVWLRYAQALLLSNEFLFVD